MDRFVNEQHRSAILELSRPVVAHQQCDQIGQLLKALGNKYFSQIAYIFRQFL